MITILVATDFSANAHWGTDYALRLAQQVHARLVVVHVYDPVQRSISPPDGPGSTIIGPYERALRLLSQLRNEMLLTTKGAVDVSIVARPGSPIDCLTAEATKQKADLLVMGLVGDEPLKARRLGSLATDMIPQTRIPMLLVPPGVVYQKPQTIVLAVDLSQPVNTFAVDTARLFARRMGASIAVVCIEDEPTEWQKKAARQIRYLIRHQPHTFTFWPGYDVAIALEDYLAQYKAEVVMLLPRPHRCLRTMLLESDTQEVARLAAMPVLAAV